MNNNKPYSRLERINNQILNIIGDAFIKRMPSSEFGLLSISRVNVSPDLRNANIFYTVFNPKKTKKELNIAINKKRKVFRKILGLKMRTKNIPDLSFFYDDTFEYQNHLNELFKKINIK
ncbi:MAG: ribosome-binding factor A [Candidatus Marinimicrobia bacterium]|nr:ribosome-binding factor A [Candidatus Neomarinimicrobiota bacterium]